MGEAGSAFSSLPFDVCVCVLFLWQKGEKAGGVDIWQALRAEVSVLRGSSKY